MACDCKANRQIYELGMRYGNTVGRTRKDILKGGVWKAVQYFFLALFAIIASPILFFIIFWKAAVKKERVFHIDDMIGLKRSQDVREQQVI